MTNSTVEIKDNKVLFSKEILEYFEDLRNEETSEWIDKYFDILSDENNLTAEKYNIHHIRPCCTFKDKEHKNRKQTQKLADKFNGNLIKLSIYNHFFAHYYLWKIFNNRDCKLGFKRMCGQSNFIDNLTENELKEIAKLQEDCAKTNKTEEEIKEHKRNYGIKYRTNNKEEIVQKKKEYYIENRERELKRVRQYRLDNIDEIREYDRERYYKNKEKKFREKKTKLFGNRNKIVEKQKARSNQKCYDPKENDICSLQALQKRKRKDKEKYKHVVPRDCIIEENQ